MDEQGNQAQIAAASSGIASELELNAYQIPGSIPMELVAAPGTRAWMDGTYERFAYRCLPLLIANQAGWLVLNTHSFRAVWDGGDGAESVTILYTSGEPPYPAVSTFGYGILTFHIPYLFRTSPGYNLLVRGPANLPKDAIAALEGLVETDWAVATFTMNWKFTRRDHVIEFAEGEPVCMLVPQRRHELEAFTPKVVGIHSETELARHHYAWADSRRRFKIYLASVPQRGKPRHLWQRHYFHGTSPTRVQAPEHQLKLKLRPFTPPGEPQ